MRKLISESGHLFFFSICMVAAGLLIAAVPGTSRAAVTVINQDTLASWITSGTTFDFILIDVRTPTELKTYGLIGTEVCRPYNFNVSDGTLDLKIPQIPAAMPVVVYCQSGGRATTAANKLDGAGILTVYRMGTGVSSWTGEKHDSSYVKPPSDLPQPSMYARGTSVAYETQQHAYPAGTPVNGHFIVMDRARLQIGDHTTSLSGQAVTPFQTKAAGCYPVTKNSSR